MELPLPSPNRYFPVPVDGHDAYEYVGWISSRKRREGAGASSKNTRNLNQRKAAHCLTVRGQNWEVEVLFRGLQEGVGPCSREAAAHSLDASSNARDRNRMS